MTFLREDWVAEMLSFLFASYSLLQAVPCACYQLCCVEAGGLKERCGDASTYLAER